jgi:hypothetical protein
MEFLRTVFRQNGYSDRQIRRDQNPPVRVALASEKPVSVAFLPYVSTTFNCISKLLSRHVKSVGLPPKKIPSFLWPVKDDLGLTTPGIYSMPCECGQVYIGQTGRFIETRSRSTSATSVWSIQTNQPWPNTASTWATTFYSRTPPSRPPSPDTQTG